MEPTIIDSRIPDTLRALDALDDGQPILFSYALNTAKRPALFRRSIDGRFYAEVIGGKTVELRRWPFWLCVIASSGQ